jgi:hypothetical protein
MHRLFDSFSAAIRCGIVAALFFVAAAPAFAETLLMPNRDYWMGQSEVVWGTSTLPNGTNYTLHVDDGQPDINGSLLNNQSYLAFNRTFPLAGTFTVTLTVGAESATTTIRVYDPNSLSPQQRRDLNINRTIQDGLRYLWTSQTSRQALFPSGVQTNWDNSPEFTALVVLAFQNHGYKLTDAGNPTGIYEKYVVRRGLNFILANLTANTLNLTPQGHNPCVGTGIEAAPCTGLFRNSLAGYSTSLAILPFAASSALGRVITEVPVSIGGFSYAGETFGEVLQRMVNALSWGQIDQNAGILSRGGWGYSLNDFTSDGSTLGWNMLALLDAAASGVTVPAFVKTEFDSFAFQAHKTAGGIFDYNPNSNPLPNVARTGVGMQSAFYVGDGVGDTWVDESITYTNNRWDGIAEGGDYTGSCGGNKMNKGCAYAMFNVFKGLRLLGVDLLSNVNRPAGSFDNPGGSVGAADDWYADYVDWLITNQSTPQTQTGGHWNGGTNRFGAATTFMSFSCCGGTVNANVAMAELILAPVALIQPDPTRFSQVGLRHGNPLTTNPDDNPVGTPHTVVATAESGGANPAPIPGVQISFQITGRNAAVSGACAPANCISGANGQVSYTYTDAGNPNAAGVDTIEAFIGQIGSNLSSNELTKNWFIPQTFTRCDADSDGDVDDADLLLIRAANGSAAGATDPRDGNADGRINVLDSRYCALRRTPAAN